jgi:hypothetical protein
MISNIKEIRRLLNRGVPINPRSILLLTEELEATDSAFVKTASDNAKLIADFARIEATVARMPKRADYVKVGRVVAMVVVALFGGLVTGAAIGFVIGASW